MKKGFGPSLRHLDLSGLADKLTQHSNDCLDLVGYNCPNLERLVLSRLNFSNKPFGKTLKYLKKLRELDVSNCYRLNDIGLARAFQRCVELNTINVSYCNALDGSCFGDDASSGRLVNVTLDGCSVNSLVLLYN